jgi:hypothetical protein
MNCQVNLQSLMPAASEAAAGQMGSGEIVIVYMLGHHY